MTPNPVDSNRRLIARALWGAVRAGSRSPSELRHHAIHESWSVVKRFGAAGVENVEPREVPCLRNAVIEGYIDDPNRATLAALCRGTGARTFFEIGTNRGRTAWTVARNNPELEVHTLDLPDKRSAEEIELDLNASDRDFFGDSWNRGEAFQETPEAERIHQLWGDSATFDFSPYSGSMDMVFVDGAHSYSYVRNDTEQALRMVSESGTIVWDDYPAIPGVYACLNDLAPTLDSRTFHILGTRMVVYSRQPLVERLGGDRRVRQA